MKDINAIIAYAKKELINLADKGDLHIYTDGKSFAMGETIMEPTETHEYKEGLQILEDRLRFYFERDEMIFLYICPDNQLMEIENDYMKENTINLEDDSYNHEPMKGLSIAWD